MNKVYKHTFSVTVLNDFRQYDPSSLSYLEYDITDGNSIGIWEKEGTTEVSQERVKDELLAIGNDGTWFDPVEGLEEPGD